MADVPLRFGYWKRLKPHIAFDRAKLSHYFKRRFFHAMTDLFVGKNYLFAPIENKQKQITELFQDGFLKFKKSEPEKMDKRAQRILKTHANLGNKISPINRKALGVIANLARKYQFEVFAIDHWPDQAYEGDQPARK